VGPRLSGNRVTKYFFGGVLLLGVTLLFVSSGVPEEYGCGPAALRSQGGIPGAPVGDSNRTGSFSMTQTMPYNFVSYETLYKTLTETLGVPRDTVDQDLSDDFGPEDDPLHNPIYFLETRKESLGAGQLAPSNPDESVVPGSFSSLGFKYWILAASGAAGIAMDNTEQRSAFFPQGTGNYDTVYLTLLGRYPTAEEEATLKELIHKAGGFSQSKQAAMVLTALMTTLEFLTVN